MSADEGAACALFGDPLPPGFYRRVLNIAPGLELDLEACGARDAILVVEEGVAEVACRSGICRRFTRGSMLPLARVPVVRVRSVGTSPLVLIAVSRAAPTPTDEFPRDCGSYVDC